MSEEKKVTQQEYFKDFPEAPASDTFKWIDGNNIEHMTTIRAWTGTALYKAVAEFEQTVIESGGRTAALQQAPKANTGNPAPVNTVTSGSANSIVIEKIKVTPEPTRIVVELFEAGHKWADIKAFYKDAGQASAAFAEVTGLNFSEPGEYQLACVADYRLSEKLNTKGNPYKNLVSVRPA